MMKGNTHTSSSRRFSRRLAQQGCAIAVFCMGFVFFEFFTDCGMAHAQGRIRARPFTKPLADPTFMCR